MHMLSKINATLSETLVVNVNKQQTNREQESYPGCKSYKSYLLICSDERTNGPHYYPRDSLPRWLCLLLRPVRACERSGTDRKSSERAQSGEQAEMDA